MGVLGDTGTWLAFSGIVVSSIISAWVSRVAQRSEIRKEELRTGAKSGMDSGRLSFDIAKRADERAAHAEKKADEADARAGRAEEAAAQARRDAGEATWQVRRYEAWHRAVDAYFKADQEWDRAVESELLKHDPRALDDFPRPPMRPPALEDYLRRP